MSVRTDADFVCDLPPGSLAESTIDGLGVRSGPAADKPVILFLPLASVVEILDCEEGWYKIRYAGTTGWCSSSYLSLVSPTDAGSDLAAPADLSIPIDASSPDLGVDGAALDSQPPADLAPRDMAVPLDLTAPRDMVPPRDLVHPRDMVKPPSPVDVAVARAKSGVGFSYHWGAGCWDPGSKDWGSCSGNCPSCSHKGKWGADCSGFVAKVWQVPGSSAVTSCSHPYSTKDFKNSHAHWNDVSRSKIKRGDAMVYNDGSRGHIFFIESGDGWGSMRVYEAKGCSYGIKYNSRTASSAYKAIRRDGY